MAFTEIPQRLKVNYPKNVSRYKLDLHGFCLSLPCAAEGTLAPTMEAHGAVSSDLEIKKSKCSKIEVNLN